MLTALPFRLYGLLPHHAVNAGWRALARLRRPSSVVDVGIRTCIRLGHIDMRDFEAGPFPSVEHFFLRRLRAGARPIGAGVVSPADGSVVGLGRIRANKLLQIKGHPYSVDALVNGETSHFDVEALEGGHYVTVFLHPSGYHYVHAPFAARIEGRHSIGGRLYPQNAMALEHIKRVYERNDRVVLTLRDERGRRALLVMVGASMVGGIHVRPVVDVHKGEEIGHFTFGSTVVLLFEPTFGEASRLELGQRVQMGAPMFSP